MGGMMQSSKTMELNPTHDIIRALVSKLDSEGENSKTVKDIVWLQYETALLASGFSLDKPVGFVDRINRLVRLGLGVDDDEDDEVGGVDAGEEDTATCTDDAEEQKETSEDDTSMEEVD